MADPAWTTACPDWERRIVAGEQLIPFGPLFPSEADEALAYFKALRIADLGTVDSSPTMGEVSRPWVLGFVASIFGAYDPGSGRRLIREWMLLISKKNGKSTIAAGVMLTALLLNWRRSAEMGILAPTKEVADNSFRPARDMIRTDPELSALLHVQDHVRTITHRGTGATLQVVAADSDAVAGKKWSVTLVDELWLFGKRANADRMLEEATGGMASRPEGFVIYLSTQSDEPPAGVFKQKLDYARGVRDGRINDREFCPVLYEFPPAMIEAGEHLEPGNFRISNPNIGASVDEQFIGRKLRSAGEAGEDSTQVVLSKFLNVQIGLQLRSNRWAGADFWSGCGDADLTLEGLLERSDVVTFGVDGGGLDDLLGAAAIGREAGTGRWLIWAHAWCNEIVLARRKEIADRLRGFAKDGDLSIEAAPGADVDQVVDAIEQCEASGLLDRIGVDAVGIGAVVDEIEARKIDRERVMAIPQGWKLMGAIKTVERRLAAGQIVHCGRPLMDWCVGNASVRAIGNAVMIEKAEAGRAKIDPLIAVFNAAALMALNPKPRKKKYQAFFVG